MASRNRSRWSRRSSSTLGALLLLPAPGSRPLQRDVLAVASVTVARRPVLRSPQLCAIAGWQRRRSDLFFDGERESLSVARLNCAARLLSRRKTHGERAHDLGAVAVDGDRHRHHLQDTSACGQKPPDSRPAAPLNFGKLLRSRLRRCDGRPLTEPGRLPRSAPSGRRLVVLNTRAQGGTVGGSLYRPRPQSGSSATRRAMMVSVRTSVAPVRRQGAGSSSSAGARLRPVASSSRRRSRRRRRST